MHSEEQLAAYKKATTYIKKYDVAFGRIVIDKVNEIIIQDGKPYSITTEFVTDDCDIIKVTKRFKK